MTSEKPTIVVVHGAWHVPAHYEPMAKPLREAGWDVIIPKHQSIGIKSDPGNALREDAVAVANVIRQQLDDDRDVILLMHSYGGISGSDAVGVLNEEQPSKGKGRIKRLVYLAAHCLEKGKPFFPPSGGHIPFIHYDENGMMVHTKPYDRYYYEISPGDAEPAVNLLEPMARSAFESSTQYSGWKDYKIPVTYIKCLKDIAVTPEMCDNYISKLKAEGIDVQAETIDAGHCCHFTAPSLVVGIIEKFE